MVTNLPYVYIWLPLLIGVVICVPALWYLLRRPQEEAATTAPAPTPSAEAPPGAPAADPFTHGSRSEKRRAVRRQGNVIKLMCAVAGTPDRHFHGYVVDRSMTGLRILVPQPYDLGTVLLIRPASLSVPWVEVEVRNSTSSKIQHDEFEVGCQNVGSPPYTTLSLFG
jgi:hypothetical protein